MGAVVRRRIGLLRDQGTRPRHPQRLQIRRHRGVQARDAGVVLLAAVCRGDLRAREEQRRVDLAGRVRGPGAPRGPPQAATRDRGRTLACRRGPHRGTGAERPMVLTATQVAAASTNNGRRPCRNKDVISFPTERVGQAVAGRIVLHLPNGIAMHDHSRLLGSLLLIRFVTLPGADGRSHASHRALSSAARRGWRRRQPSAAGHRTGRKLMCRGCRDRRGSFVLGDDSATRARQPNGRKPWTGSWKSWSSRSPTSTGRRASTPASWAFTWTPTPIPPRPCGWCT